MMVKVIPVADQKLDLSASLVTILLQCQKKTLS